MITSVWCTVAEVIRQFACLRSCTERRYCFWQRLQHRHSQNQLQASGGTNLVFPAWTVIFSSGLLPVTGPYRNWKSIGQCIFGHHVYHVISDLFLLTSKQPTFLASPASPFLHSSTRLSHPALYLTVSLQLLVTSLPATFLNSCIHMFVACNDCSVLWDVLFPQIARKI